jgi:hypothetical protein
MKFSIIRVIPTEGDVNLLLKNGYEIHKIMIDGAQLNVLIRIVDNLPSSEAIKKAIGDLHIKDGIMYVFSDGRLIGNFKL